MHCYLRISVAGSEPRTVSIKLYPDKCPKTCNNFAALCSSKAVARKPGKGTSGQPSKIVEATYRGTEFHRIVPGMCVQGGDFEKFDGTGGSSAEGGTFADESFAIKHDREGVVSMANRGKNTNGSQFFITLQKCPHLDNKHVAFGQVVSGMDVIREMGKVETEDKKGRPVAMQRILITNCGLGKGNVDSSPSSSEAVAPRERRKRRSRSRSDSRSGSHSCSHSRTGSRERRRRSKKKHHRHRGRRRSSSSSSSSSRGSSRSRSRKRDHRRRRKKRSRSYSSDSSSSRSRDSSRSRSREKSHRPRSSKHRRKKESKRRRKDRHKTRKKKKHKKATHEKRTSKESDSSSSSSDNDDPNVRRSAISGKRIKMHIDKSEDDLVREKARKDMLKFMNASV